MIILSKGMVSADTDSLWLLRVADTFLASSWHQVSGFVILCAREFLSMSLPANRREIISLVKTLLTADKVFDNKY